MYFLELTDEVIESEANSVSFIYFLLSHSFMQSSHSFLFFISPLVSGWSFTVNSISCSWNGWRHPYCILLIPVVSCCTCFQNQHAVLLHTEYQCWNQYFMEHNILERETYLFPSYLSFNRKTLFFTVSNLYCNLFAFPLLASVVVISGNVVQGIQNPSFLNTYLSIRYFH